MRKSALVLVGVALLIASCSRPRDGQPALLRPGERITIDQSLDINIVMVGFEQGDGMQQIDQNTSTARE